MKLNDIRDNPGARPKRTQLGRGIGSTKGKTAGRGYKGQRARTGVRLDGFEGGQMPIFRRLPKRGFTNIFKPRYSEINVGRLQKAIDEKRLDAGAAMDAASLSAAGVIGHVRDGLKLLGDGEIKAPIKITVTAATKSALEAVEKAGGAVTLLPRPVKPEGKLKKKPASPDAPRGMKAKKKAAGAAA